MANEITLSAALAFIKNNIGDSLSVTDLQIDVSGTKCVHNVQNVGFAADEALQKGDMSTPGLILVVNRDDTNFVSFRPADEGTSTIKVKAGEWQLFRFETTDPLVIADTAAVTIEYLLIED